MCVACFANALMPLAEPPPYSASCFRLIIPYVLNSVPFMLRLMACVHTVPRYIKMCGLAGYFSLEGRASDETCRQMADKLFHRGPDDSGIWLEKESGIALGHRRLSIQDLSLHGHQPMHAASGRYVIVYNGEVYNFRKLQKALEAMRYGFHGHLACTIHESS